MELQKLVVPFWRTYLLRFHARHLLLASLSLEWSLALLPMSIQPRSSSRLPPALS
jgi:hypothetical protein